MKFLEYLYFYREIYQLVITRKELPQTKEDQIVFVYIPEVNNYRAHRWGALRPSANTDFKKIQSVAKILIL